MLLVNDIDKYVAVCYFDSSSQMVCTLLKNKKTAAVKSFLYKRHEIEKKEVLEKTPQFLVADQRQNSFIIKASRSTNS